MLSRVAAVALAAMILGWPSPLAGQERPSSPATLAGRWEIDPSRSDRPGRMDRGGPLGGLSGGGRRPGGGGRLPGGGRSGSLPDGGRRGLAESGSPAITQLLRPSRNLDVGFTDSTISILDGAGFTRLLRSDGREQVDTLFSGEVRRTRVKRKANEFVLEQTIDGDTKIRERYRFDDGAGDLVLDLKLESKRMPIPVEIRRFYFRVKAEGASRGSGRD